MVSKSFTEDILAVGGSGLYVKAIIDRYEFKPTDPTIRSELEQLNLLKDDLGLDDNFRQEIKSEVGLTSYPHPWLMPNYW